MKILRAEHLGMCFGVRDAIALARKTAQHEPLTILGDLVHNETAGRAKCRNQTKTKPR
jgi:4-hydroxy-3-methylbut-2-enyl diphosphate reductase